MSRYILELLRLCLETEMGGINKEKHFNLERFFFSHRDKQNWIKNGHT